MCLTFIFKVNYQGQVTDFGFSEILNIVNVRIVTKVKSAACIQPELKKRSYNECGWPWVQRSTVKVTQFFFNIFDILDLENVRIDTKINFVSCLQPEIWKVTQKGVWPWFSRSCNIDRIFSLSPSNSLTPKTYPREIFSKNSDEKAKIQGVGTHPLRRFRLAKYLGRLRIKTAALRCNCSVVEDIYSFIFSFIYLFYQFWRAFSFTKIILSYRVLAMIVYKV